MVGERKVERVKVEIEVVSPHKDLHRPLIYEAADLGSSIQGELEGYADPRITTELSVKARIPQPHEEDMFREDRKPIMRISIHHEDKGLLERYETRFEWGRKEEIRRDLLQMARNIREKLMMGEY